MVVRTVLSYATQRAAGLVVHPKQTAGALVGDVAHVVDTAAQGVRLVAGTVLDRGRADGTDRADAPPAEADSTAEAPASAKPADYVADPVIERPGPVPEEVRRTATSGAAPKPEPPKQPRTATKVGEEILTPSGIPAAGPGHNPSTGETDLIQPDTEPLMDPGTAKALRKEAATLQKGARNRPSKKG